MVAFWLLFFSLFPYLLPLHAAEYWKYTPRCLPVDCDTLGRADFPLSPFTPDSGLFRVSCSNQTIQLEEGGRWFDVYVISKGDIIFINDKLFWDQLHKQHCEIKFPVPSSILFSFQFILNNTLFKCNDSNSNIIDHYFDLNYKDYSHFRIYYNYKNVSFPNPTPHYSTIQISRHRDRIHDGLFKSLVAEFQFQEFISSNYSSCHYKSPIMCQINGNGDFQCANTSLSPDHCRYDSKGGLRCDNARKGDLKSLGLKLGLGLGCPAAIIIISLSICFVWHRYKKKHASTDFLAPNTSSDLSTRSDLERRNVYFGVHIFSYTELEEATNNFDSEKELGNGGFGTVYYCKLQDGREVAVKRLYDHNYKRVKRFINEIEILTRLRHNNLVSLYGCTSYRSRELLLVYEYIPNGTVADHLHSDRANFSPLTWPVRMRIAVETASALVYLHACDIIHRDVKTNNILLDNNFSVKVADFGLSRLFPNDVTHISTAPQGTPGYVDPEYHQCYQLTNKSDVYSFGVVLIELISSMPAVDMTRHRHEINLATLAINKIQKCAFDELIDPSLGYNSDVEVQRMTTSVAELAFLCLQQDKELRPSMNEVLKELERIESGDYELENLEKYDNDVVLKNIVSPSSPQDCSASLLKNIQPPHSPNSVTDKWVSSSYTIQKSSG